MTNNVILRDPLHFDISSERNSDVREELRNLFKELDQRNREIDNFWPTLGTGGAERIPANSLVCGDLSCIVRAFASTDKHRWIARIRETNPFIVAFIRTKTDDIYVDRVDDLVRTSDLRVSVCRFQPRSKKGWLAACLNEAVISLHPGSILEVRYSRSDQSIWVEFGDGLSGSVRPSDLGFEDPGELKLETATVGPYHSSVKALDRAGNIVDIDGESVRALLDQNFAQEIATKAENANRSLGERLKRQRNAAGITQAELAARTGLDQSVISKLEGGKHQPRWDTIQRYAAGIEKTPERLLAELT